MDVDLVNIAHQIVIIRRLIDGVKAKLQAVIIFVYVKKAFNSFNSLQQTDGYGVPE